MRTKFDVYGFLQLKETNEIVALKWAYVDVRLNTAKTVLVH